MSLTTGRGPLSPNPLGCFSAPIPDGVVYVVLVDTTDTLVVYETALLPRLYVSKAAVRTDVLSASNSTSWCSYKGKASWWHATVNGVLIRDAAWSYDEALQESSALRGLLAFDDKLATIPNDLPHP